MEIHFRPETESRLRELAQRTGRAPNELIEDAMSGYLEELAQLRGMLDSRYEELQSGRVQAIDGETAFERLRRKSQERRARS
jgi:predicted DNA-binding protein